ncbi:SIR2 family protein [Limnobacter sp.]|uniref:SIR2 family protein n=1 Tax=Limnobacter sp. TaxID=2003368 RepID=UPI00258296EB|nr:SIR2 family protein [Limnobacter sp.]
MQFITNGPDVPDTLLQAHEEGRVVFFCGAGISRPAGLPDFGGLVKQLFQRAGEPADKVETDLFEQSQFDRAIGRYERRIQGGRTTTRRGLPSLLTADPTKRRALTTHFALLTLGKSRNDVIKLVTTNFDTLFEVAASLYGLPAPTIYHDPPTRLHWDGVVHLHGRMPVQPSTDDLNQLVLSDGDFGQAYLTQGWAARFVAGLFRDYTLCFVGYSIDDPVLRYMTAAHALDGVQKMFAFASYENGKAESALQAWKDKHVIPVLYDDAASHQNLHRTLQVWASVYRDGIDGKERLVARYAHRLPKESKSQNDFAGRLLWALSDQTGLPAKRFADSSPAPSLDWLLDAFSEERYRYSDLARFNVIARKKIDGNLRFSLIRRPAPYDRAQPMRLVSGVGPATEWDEVMFHLARWLVRHLDDPRLVIWIAERGGQLHDRLQWLIERELDLFDSLEREGKAFELDEIRLHAPKAIPSTLMRTLWRLLLSNRVKSPGHDLDLYRWEGRLKREGLTTTLRLELRELLTPKVILKKPIRWSEDDSSNTDEPERIKQLVDWELTLVADDVYSALRNLTDKHWVSALPLLLDDFQRLLLDALDLLRELGEADDHSDRSHWDLPSITPHWQNRGFRDWVSLIELQRDAWLAIRANDSERATSIAQSWFELPYPTLKRLALFAASHDDCIQPEQWVDWLLTDEAWWLWSTDTGREVFRLLVLQGQHLAGIAQQSLEEAILAGPPRKMYRDDLEVERWQELVDRSVWLYLAKLNTSGLTLGTTASTRLTELSTTYPKWQLATNEHDEFSHWMSGTGDPDYQASRDIEIAPRKRQELVKWLTKPMPKWRPFYEDTWRDVSPQQTRLDLGLDFAFRIA